MAKLWDRHPTDPGGHAQRTANARSSVSSSTGPGRSGPSPPGSDRQPRPSDRPVHRDTTRVVPGVGTPTAWRSTTRSPWPTADPPNSTIWPSSATTTTSQDLRGLVLSRDGTGPDGHPSGDRTPAPLRTGTGPRHGHRRGRSERARQETSEPALIRWRPIVLARRGLCREPTVRAAVARCRRGSVFGREVEMGRAQWVRRRHDPETPAGSRSRSTVLLSRSLVRPHRRSRGRPFMATATAPRRRAQLGAVAVVMT